jgi:mevalonate kinase
VLALQIFIYIVDVRKGVARTVRTSSPGKVILFGEHAVVYGEPAIALAVSRRFHMQVEEAGGGKVHRVDGHKMTEAYHSYFKYAVDNYWEGGPLDIRTRSEIPSSSGMGSSAALTTSLMGCLVELSGESLGDERERIARQSFATEYGVQGRASPTDTSTATMGMGILLAKEPSEGLLWHIERGGAEWYIHSVDVPQLTIVVGFTGLKGNTGELVAKVRRYWDSNTFAKETVSEIGELTMRGVQALRDGDTERIGRLMDRNHQLLTILGVNHPKLQRLIDAVRPYSFGAKLTGAGGGGSMIALTEEPDRVSQAIEAMGGTPFIAEIGAPGLHLDTD